MIPILGAMPPESIMPFGAISGPSVSGAGNVDVTLPSWVRNVGRYSLLMAVVGSWGQSQEHAGVDVLDGAGGSILSMTEGYAISGAFLSATQAYHDGSGLVVTDASTSWDSRAPGSHTNYFLFEGIAGAATVRLRSVAGNPGNPSYFGPWSVLGVGRGRRDPANWSALKAAMTTNDGYLRIICS